MTDPGQPLSDAAYEAMGVMPFSEFPAAHQARINAQCAESQPPPGWLRGECFAMPSRAHYEWYWRRGREPYAEKSSRPAIRAAVRRAVIERDGHVCRYCGVEVTRRTLQLDHVVPYSRGGDNSADNLVVACKPCNLSKHARTPDEWRGRA